MENKAELIVVLIVFIGLSFQKEGQFGLESLRFYYIFLLVIAKVNCLSWRNWKYEQGSIFLSPYLTLWLPGNNYFSIFNAIIIAIRV